MAIEKAQQGIKWWQRCARCGWIGKALKQDNDQKACPNCAWSPLNQEQDFHVYNGKRYQAEVRNPSDQAVADQARKDARLEPVKADTRDESKPGHQTREPAL